MSSAAAAELVWELSGLHRRLREVLEGVPVELLDRAPAADANSIAVLVTHAIGSVMGWLHLAAGRPHQRDRDSEFVVRGRSSDDLIRLIDEADRMAPELVQAAFDAGMETLRERPGARAVTVAYCLTHAAAHTAEHVGQAELTRQIIAPRTTPA